MEGKIFLGGLTWQTTDEMLKTHFGKWGSLSDVILMRNKITGEPRGFGFVQFQHASCEFLWLNQLIVSFFTVFLLVTPVTDHTLKPAPAVSRQ